MKKIEDYLHLYLGCECEANDGSRGLLVSYPLDGSSARINEKINNGMNGGWVYPKEELKPILRPLSDMTEEELRKVCKIKGASIPDGGIHKRMKGKDWAQWYYIFDNREEIIANLSSHKNGFMVYRGNDYFWTNLELFQFMLSKSFDLFGLIESGLALDSIAITNNTKTI